MNSDLEIEKGLSYKQLLQLYSDHFSLGYLNTDFKNKMALISMICYLTYQLKLKKPDVTHYQIVMKMADGLGLPEDFLKGLSVVCDSFGYGCTEFPTFNLTAKEMIKSIKEILSKYIPF